MAVNLEAIPLPGELPAIPDGWRYESLGDLVEARGVSYGIVQPGSETTAGVPIVRVNMGDDKLKVIAAELITQVRKSATIDWTLRESARARIRVMVKRIMNKYGYPPDLQEEAVKTVLMQAELLCADWV